jgi:AcrR family transcriptional regulator
VKDLLSNLQLSVNDHIFLKNPDSSELGRKIIGGSIDLMDELGFECFTFRKLASEINSTEASVYRYFVSKHKLLLYLTSWYWSWMEYRLVFGLANIKDPAERLKKAIVTLTETVEEDGAFEHINEIRLNRIVISEASKVYLTKEVDAENKDGVFIGYKQLVARVSDIITELAPAYKYPHMLVSTVIEGAHHQRYFADHLPRLTDVVKGEDAITTFSLKLVFNALADH